MVDATSSMSQKEKSAFASSGLPDPKLYIDKETEGQVLTDTKDNSRLIKAGRKSRRNKRKQRRSKKLTLKFRKIR
jgi:hypothetical protein